MGNEKPHTPHLRPEDVKPEERLKVKIDELKIRIDTSRFYLNVALQINGFFYLTAGAVLGFYLKEPKGEQTGGHLVFFLLLPILIGSVLGGIFIYGARLQKDSSIKIERLRSELNDDTGLDIGRIPDIHLLRLLLLIFGTIFFFVTAALICVPYLTEVSSGTKPTISGDELRIFSTVGIVILIMWVFTGLILLPFLARRLDKGLDACVKRLVSPDDKR